VPGSCTRRLPCPAGQARVGDEALESRKIENRNLPYPHLPIASARLPPLQTLGPFAGLAVPAIIDWTWRTSKVMHRRSPHAEELARFLYCGSRGQPPPQFSVTTGRLAGNYLRPCASQSPRRCSRTAFVRPRLSIAIGYEDAAYLRGLFKRCTGMTPGEHRESFTGVNRTPPEFLEKRSR